MNQSTLCGQLLPTASQPRELIPLLPTERSVSSLDTCSRCCLPVGRRRGAAPHRRAAAPPRCRAVAPPVSCFWRTLASRWVCGAPEKCRRLLPGRLGFCCSVQATSPPPFQRPLPSVCLLHGGRYTVPVEASAGRQPRWGGATAAAAARPPSRAAADPAARPQRPLPVVGRPDRPQPAS